MQILIPDSWLREYLDTNASPKDIQKCLSLCGPSIERLEKTSDDYIYDVEVTTNRVDCMSIIGIAREAVAILPRFGFKAALKSNHLSDNISTISTKTQVEYLKLSIDKDLCKNFSAILIKDCNIAPSSKKIADRLEKIGINSINNVVDITNYLTHELGQPMHVFDYNSIQKHSMTLRLSKKSDSVITLDGNRHDLSNDDIVIEDGIGNIIDLCGIMGANNSSVNYQTKDVLLFVQTYSPTHIRRSSMRLGIRTNAAILFEKGLNSHSVLPTLKHALQLIEEESGGTGHKDILSVDNTDKASHQIKFDKDIEQFLSETLGISLNKSEILNILNSLNINLINNKTVEIPWYRVNDIQIQEDITEEIARIYGYHNLPSNLMSGDIPLDKPSNNFDLEYNIKLYLKHQAFNEVYTYSLVENDDLGIPLKNPLSSDWSVLRTNLASSHHKIIKSNLGKEIELNFFEIANIYLPNSNSLPKEIQTIIISSSSQNMQKFKGIIESMLDEFNIHLNPQIKSEEGILYWEHPISELASKYSKTKSYTPISKFEKIYLDINFKKPTSYADLERDIYKITNLIKSIELIDSYQDRITLRLTFHSNEKQLSHQDLEVAKKAIENISY